MSYMHMENLYKNTTLLLFKKCYALEKVHGTSAHVSWNDGSLRFFAGGSSHEIFVALFDQEGLSAAFTALGHNKVIVYGEAYGGKLQGMSKTYGPDLRFIGFEVQIGDIWLNVPNAADVCDKIGIEFVPWVEIDTTLEAIDAERDRPSIVAERRGMGADKLREGVVLHPPQEFVVSNGARVICKHKGEAFCETLTPREVGKALEITAAEQAAFEWVTDMRLAHVLDALGNPRDMSDTQRVIAGMIEDVLREGTGEIEDTKETRRAIGRATLVLWKKHATRVIGEGEGG